MFFVIRTDETKKGLIAVLDCEYLYPYNVFYVFYWLPWYVIFQGIHIPSLIYIMFLINFKFLDHWWVCFIPSDCDLQWCSFVDTVFPGCVSPRVSELHQSFVWPGLRGLCPGLSPGGVRFVLRALGLHARSVTFSLLS